MGGYIRPVGGLALLNDCKYGYKLWDNVLDLCLLRSQNCPCEHGDIGKHSFTYAVYPHGGDVWDGGVVREGYCLNYRWGRSGHPQKRRNVPGVRVLSDGSGGDHQDGGGQRQTDFAPVQKRPEELRKRDLLWMAGGQSACATCWKSRLTARTWSLQRKAHGFISMPFEIQTLLVEKTEELL